MNSLSLTLTPVPLLVDRLAPRLLPSLGVEGVWPRGRGPPNGELRGLINGAVSLAVLARGEPPVTELTLEVRSAEVRWGLKHSVNGVKDEV